MIGSETYKDSQNEPKNGDLYFDITTDKLWQYGNTRLKALELASKLRSSDGEPMTLKELIGKAEELLEWINKP